MALLTYEDLVAVGERDVDRIVFVQRCIREHKASPAYHAALEAQAYYEGENPTIMRYEKILYDLQGLAHVDMWTANHKIASSFFTFVIDQEISYLLGNGVRFGDSKTKDKLGKDFDQEVMDALEYARIAGTSFGFWNYDHVDVFKLTEFCPLLGEETGALMAGVRFWQLANDKPLRATLYELDGYTELIQGNGEDMRILKDKTSYKTVVRSNKAEGTEITDGGNYDGFPIVPLYSGKNHKPALNGHRNTIDALDLGVSNMINNVDEGNLIYWVLTNCGGMDDMDDAKFIDRIKTMHVAHADGDSGAKAEAHTLEAPYDGTKVTIDMLRDQLYDDFQAFDAKSMAAGDMSATAIRAGYTRLDMKCDKIEREVTRFINSILELAGIDDDPTYQRNAIVNKQEEIQSIIMQADYFDEEYIMKKLLAINGDIDMYDEIAERMDAENADRLREAEARLKELEAQGNQNGQENQQVSQEDEGAGE
jgi:hypothetical protein